ncbi:hypothetical protein [Micromonospora sp. LOL_023]|uniref:hypothetical protein n=1 Tax=Micromonospora sp. LOL_023 TaxID=3345418 RepID=UPI003A8557D5
MTVSKDGVVIEDLGEQNSTRTAVTPASRRSRLVNTLRWPQPRPWPARQGWTVAGAGLLLSLIGAVGVFIGDTASVVGFGVALVGGALIAMAVAYRIRRSWPALLVALGVALVGLVLADLASIAYLNISGDQVTATVATADCAAPRGGVVDCDYEWQDSAGTIPVSDLLSDDQYEVGDQADLVVDRNGWVSARPVDAMSPDPVSLAVGLLGGPLLLLLVVRCLAVGESWLRLSPRSRA